MVSTKYYSMDYGPCKTVPKPVNSKEKTPTGNRSVFRRLSLGKSEITSMSEERDEFYDEMPTLRSDEMNMNKIKNKNRTHIIRTSDFNGFEAIPSWGFDDNCKMKTDGTKNDAVEFEAFQINSPEDFEALYIDPEALRAKKMNGSKPESSHSAPSTRPSSSKLSKSKMRMKDQFKYRSFTNEKRVPRSKMNSNYIETIPAIEQPQMLDGRDDIEHMYHLPENFPSLVDSLMMHKVVPPNRNSIGPLMPHTRLKLSLNENLSIVPDMAASLEPSCEDLVVESVFLKKKDIAPNGDVVATANYDEAEKKDGDSVYETSSYPSEFDHSTIFSGRTENLPLLRPWGLNTVNCDNCGTSKELKKKRAKKKRVEVRKKMIDDMWQRKHFYWKYESVEEQSKKHLEQLNTLVFKIAPGEDDGRDDDVVEIPLGFQLSTITEGDEDACLSPRSMIDGPLQRDGPPRSISAGPIQHSGNKPSKATLESILGEKDNEDEVEAEVLPRKPAAQNSENEAPGCVESNNQDFPRKVKRSKRRMRVVSLDEIEIRRSFDDGSAGDSRGNISDITDDYLHIPFSSPLYKKVLKAFREAEAAQRDGKNEPSEELQDYLHWV